MSALTSLLARDQVVPVRKIEEALQKQVVSGGEMSSVLLELDALPENTLAAYCAALYQLLPATRDEVMRVPRDTVRIVPREIAERHRIVPLAVDGRTLVVAMAHPLNGDVEEQLGFLLGFDLVTRIVCDARISAALIHHYGLDAPPRHVRLIERLRQRDPGAIPYVAPPREGKIDRASLASQLPSKRASVAGFLDDDDDDEEIAPAAPVKRPSSQVPAEGRTTDPMGVPAPKLGRAASTGDPISPVSAGTSAPAPSATASPAGVGGEAGAGSEPAAAPRVTSAGGWAAGRAKAAPAPAPAPASDTAPSAPRAPVATPPPTTRPATIPDAPSVPSPAAATSSSTSSSAPRRPASIPPSPVVGVGVRRSEPPASQPSPSQPSPSQPSPSQPSPSQPSPSQPSPSQVSPTQTSPAQSSRPGAGTSEPPTETQRALRKLRGPLTAAVAVKMLEEAPDRDSILEIFFAFARQFFDYAAIFVVHDDVADGRDSFGTGAPPAAVRRIAVPLDVPGVLGDARRSLQLRVGRLATSELDTIVLRDLARDPETVAIVLPIAIRGRAVVLFYGDRSGDPFEQKDVPELVALVPRVVDAFERLILRKKRSTGFQKPADAAPDRDALKAAAKSLALSVPARTSAVPAAPAGGGAAASARAPSVRPTDPLLPRAPEAPAIPPLSALREARERAHHAPLPSASSADSGSMWERAPSDASVAEPREPRRARRASSANLEAAGALAADLVSAPAPVPAAKPAASIDVASLAGPGRTKTLQAMLGIPRDAPLPPEAHLSLPPASEPPPPPAPSGSDDDEPELTVGAADDDDDLDAGDDAPGRATLPDRALDDGGADVETPAHDPLPLTRARGTKPAPSTYIMKDASVDVVPARKRGSMPPPARSSSRPDPRAEEHTGSDAPVAQDVVHVPAIDARRSAASSSEVRRDRVAPPAASEEMPSVIVDMGDQVNALVVDLSNCGPDDEGAAVEALLRIGEAALPTLAQAFPGPVWFDRRRPYRRLPRGRDVSAIGRALVAFRERAVPYVASLLGAGQPDRRFHATLVAGELVHPGILAALSDRVFDDDDGVRAATLELLPRFRVIAGEWDDSLTVIRRAAKIRGRDPVRRRRAARALGAMRDPGALRILVELLDDEDHELGEIAHRSLVEITCEDMGTAARRWMPWLQKNEARHRIEWLIDALSHSDEAIRTSAGEELKSLTQQYYGYHPASPRKEREVVQQKYRRWWDEEGRRSYGASA